MNRTVAFRAGLFFTCLAALFTAIGIASEVQVAEAIVLVAGSLSALLCLYAISMPIAAPVPVRIRRRRR